MLEFNPINFKKMENSGSKSKAKTKSTVKKGSSATASKPAGTKKVSAKSLPGEDEIRIKAQQIYNERILSGENGTAEDDWLKAERLLKD
jgi:hypothetical protein